MKPYAPDIAGYKPFYIQTAEDSAALDTAVEWGLVAKTNPVPMLPTPKEPYKNDFKDENGDDEVCSEMFYESFTMKVQFYVKAFSDAVTGRSAEAVLNEQLRMFFQKVSSGEFSIYDSYTGLGYRNVRYSGCSNDSIDYLSRDNWARMIVEVEFKVNDPITRMTLSNGSLAVNPLVKLTTDAETGESVITEYDVKLNVIGGDIDPVTGAMTLTVEEG